MAFEPLTKEQEDAVLIQVGYTREQLEVDVQVIREWLKKQHHLPPSRLKENDSFIQHFLTGCKGSMEKTKRKIDAYYTIRAYSEIFENRDVQHPENAVAWKFVYFAAIPKIMGTENPVRVTAVKLQDLDPEIFCLRSYSAVFFNLAEYVLREEKLSIRNLIIFDSEGLSPGHILKIKPFLMKEVIITALETFALRVDKILYINAPGYIEIALNNLIIPFFSKKIRDRVIVSSNGYEELHKFIDKKYLPKDYGGECASLKELHEYWCKLELERRDWYINELSEKCDESKRIVQGDTQENPYFGVHGSLKKLVID